MEIKYDLPEQYDLLTERVKKLRQAQIEYFAGTKKNYNQPHKLQTCKDLEKDLKEWINLNWQDRKEPAAYSNYDEPALKDYLHMMDRVVYMLQQQAEFYRSRDGKQLQKCKRLEKEVDDLVKKRNTPVLQATLL